MTSEDVRAALEDAALELGFDAVGWAAARPDARELNAFQAWLDAGMHAGMTYLPRGLARRADPESSLSGARATLVLAVSHAHADPGVPAGGTRVGRVARYAWSRDYHEVLRAPLEALEGVAARLGARARAYVDHGPVLERGLAVRAGVGWRGRSSQVISTRLGAFTSLAALLTDVEPPEVDAGHADRCGTCSRCVTACPTAAITADGFVDARRCLAYFTVEHRGSIPEAFRAALGDHLFGCDDCLDACPWSTKAGRIASLLEPDAELAHPDVEAFFTLSGHEFERRFAGTAFARSRRRGLARNAAIVLGNTGDAAFVPLLEVGASDAGADVREASAWALGRIGGRRARGALERLSGDADAAVAGTARRALAGEA